MIPHRYPPHFWTLSPRSSDTTHLTLTPSEALPAGAFKSWVGGVADAPMQTGPGEAGVSLILAVCACVARATQTAEGVHAIHTGSSIEAGTEKIGQEGQAPPTLLSAFQFWTLAILNKLKILLGSFTHGACLSLGLKRTGVCDFQPALPIPSSMCHHHQIRQIDEESMEPSLVSLQSQAPEFPAHAPPTWDCSPASQSHSGSLHNQVDRCR